MKTVAVFVDVYSWGCYISTIILTIYGYICKSNIESELSKLNDMVHLYNWIFVLNGFAVGLFLLWEKQQEKGLIEEKSTPNKAKLTIWETIINLGIGLVFVYDMICFLFMSSRAIKLGHREGISWEAFMASLACYMSISLIGILITSDYLTRRPKQ